MPDDPTAPVADASVPGDAPVVDAPPVAADPVADVPEPQPVDADGNLIPTPDAVPVVNASDPQAPVDPPVVVSDPEPTAPSSESATDPTADAVVPVVSEATPDTPPSDSEDAYAQNLAQNLAGAPVDSDVRTEEQLSGIETASAALLEAVRGLAVAGLSRGQLADSCKLAVEQLYVERRDAQVTGNDDPYPGF